MQDRIKIVIPQAKAKEAKVMARVAKDNDIPIQVHRSVSTVFKEAIWHLSVPMQLYAVDVNNLVISGGSVQL